MDILVADDEKLARQRLVRMINKLENYRVVGEAHNGKEALRQAEELKPDVVLLDIRMPDMDGMEAARHIMQLDTPPAIIFCTAFQEHALEAFHTRAVGYLLKPVKADQLQDALANARKLTKIQLNSISADTIEQKTFRGRKHISAKTRLGLELVPVEDVRCFQADHKYVTAFHTNGELLIDDTLKELEEEFSGRFVRIHRNSLASLHHIEGMEKSTDGQYTVRLAGVDIKPPVSRRHVTDLRKQLRQL
jgi:two-component system response regulator AlgR